MIVNPWFFYLMYVIDNFYVFLEIVTFLSSAIAFGSTVFLFIELNDDTCIARQCRRAIKIALPVTIIGALMMIFVPDKDSLLMIQAAKLTTTDNVNAVFEALKSAIDYAAGVLK